LGVILGLIILSD